jgi:predicted GH43/DUF377 family glycosyl hydrolase
VTSKLYVQKRGPSGGSNVDYSAFTGRKGVPFFDGSEPTIQFGHRYDNAAASQGTFRLMDPDAELPRSDFNYNLPAHALVTWTEDAPGAEVWLARGRIAQSDGGRGLVAIDDEVEFDNTVDDGNVELRGQAFTEPWIRPSESDVARLIALQAYTLNGASSTATHHRDTCAVTVSASHLAPNSNTVTMPAKKYLPGTQPSDVVQDCADTAGKMYGVVIHHTGGSHLCLLYIINADHSTYASPIKISDHLADWDPTDGSAPVYEPHWEAGKATLYDGQTLLSGMVGIWQSETGIFVEYAGNDESYDYWVDPYHDGVSSSSGQAANRTAGILEERRLTHVTHRVSIIMQDDQVDMVAAGMSLQIKAAAVLAGQYLDSYQTRRVAECQFEPRLDGRYWAHLQLDRPTLRVAPGKGKASSAPPQAPVTSVPSDAVSDLLWTFDTDVYDTTDTYPGGPRWDAAGFIWAGNLNPSTSVAGITLANNTYHFRAIIRSRDADLKGIEVINQSGSALGSSGNVVGNGATEVTFDFTKGGADGLITFRSTGPSSGHNTEILEAEISHGTGTPAFVGTPPPPAPTDQTGSIGTPGSYAPADHQHPAQSADVTQIVDSGGYYPGAIDVEDALQQLGAGGTSGIGDSVAKIGQILVRDTAIASETNRIDSPTIFWDNERQRWGMVYTGYSQSGGSPLQASIHLAHSDDLLTWEKYASNPILAGDGSGSDSNGCTGGYIYYEGGIYYLFYIGLTANGYEGGTKTLNVATATDPQGTWTRSASNPLISPSGGSTWYSSAIWHPNIVKDGDVYYLFFNATGTIAGDTKERIGYATASALDGPWTVNATHVLAPTGTGSDWDGDWVADPSLYRHKDIWYMAYGGKGTGAQEHGQDGIAWTTVDDFPTGWSRFEDNPVLLLGEEGLFDDGHAHKPFIVPTPAALFHFYTGIDEIGAEWSFGLALSGPLPVPNVEDHDHLGAVVDLDDLSDVAISSPIEGDILRFDGGTWVNYAGHWEAVTDGEDVFVWEGDDLVHEWSTT